MVRHSWLEQLLFLSIWWVYLALILRNYEYLYVVINYLLYGFTS